MKGIQVLGLTLFTLIAVPFVVLAIAVAWVLPLRWSVPFAAKVRAFCDRVADYCDTLAGVNTREEWDRIDEEIPVSYRRRTENT